MSSIKSGALPQREMGSIKSWGAAATKTEQYKKRGRSEEHTSELQSLTNLVCRLLLEKKKKHKAKLQERQQNAHSIKYYTKQKK